MRPIHHKPVTLRIAKASATLEMKPETLELVRTNTGPKQDILPTARAAGFLAVKNTAMTIPHCHPIPVEDLDIDYHFGDGELKITVEVKTIYKTGCEIEAMHGAGVVALTIFDMLKPVDKAISIREIKLEEKSGGKSDYREHYPRGVKAAIIVCSDSVAEGKKEDKAGKAIREALEGYEAEIESYTILPDEPEAIRKQVLGACDRKVELIITTGGTGLGPRDSTPEALQGLIEQEIPGIMEAARAYGQQRMPYAMLSRSIAGLRGRSLIMTLPGSTRGAKESVDALFPYCLHIFEVLEKGYQHLPPEQGK